MLGHFGRLGISGCVFFIKTLLSLLKEFFADNSRVVTGTDDPLRPITYFIGFVYGPVPADISCIAGILDNVLQGTLFKGFSTAGFVSLGIQVRANKDIFSFTYLSKIS